MKKSTPRHLVDAFLNDEITKSEYIEMAESYGVRGKKAFVEAEKLETLFKWKGIKKLIRKVSP